MTKPQIVMALVIVFASIGVGCSPTPASPQNVAQTTQPRSWIDAPLDGTRLPLAPVEVVSHSTDPSGIAVVELSVDGKVMRNDSNQDATQLLVTMQQSWSPSAPGKYTLSARAENRNGTWGSPASVVVTIGNGPESGQTPAPTTIALASPTTNVPIATPTLASIANRTLTPAPREPQGPRAPVLVAPVDGTAVDCGRVNLTWKPAEDPNGIRYYDLELEKLVDRTFVSEKTWNNVRGESTPFDGSCDTHYRWRARATDNGGNQSSWSSYGYFRVKASVSPAATPTPTLAPRDTKAPRPPTQIAPVDGVSVDCVQVNLTWNAVQDASGIRGYDVELEKLVDRTYTAEKSWNNLTGESVSFDPTCDTHYRWRIRATDNAGNQSIWTDYQDFQVRAIIQ